MKIGLLQRHEWSFVVAKRQWKEVSASEATLHVLDENNEALALPFYKK